MDVVESGLNITDVSSMNVMILKENLKQRNLSSKGKKDELKMRLLDSIRVNNCQSVCNDTARKDYVSISEHNALASDFTDFKEYVTNRLNQLEKGNESSKLVDLQREIKFLRDELNNKHEIIKILQQDNEALRSAQTTTASCTNEFKTIPRMSNKPEYNPQQQIQTTNPFLTSNRFNTLDNEPSYNIWNIHDDNSFTRKNRNATSKNNNKKSNRFIVQNPEQNSHYLRNNLTATGTKKTKRNILIIGDSIIKRVDHRFMNNNLSCGRAFIKSFPGATVKQLEHYIIPHLLERSPDAVVIHVGTNDIRPRDSRHVKSSLEIANHVISVAKKCKEYGVTDVFVSGITCRSVDRDMKKVLDTNCHIMNQCNSENFHFISNNNIQLENLFEDGIHLGESGLRILNENFFTSLNRNLM